MKSFKELYYSIEKLPTGIEAERNRICTQIKDTINGKGMWTNRRWTRMTIAYREQLTHELIAAGFKVKSASEDDGSIIIDW